MESSQLATRLHLAQSDAYLGRVPPIVRAAEEVDLAEIARIYNISVERSLAVFTETPATIEDRAIWLVARRTAGYPVLVAVQDAHLVGFASFGDFRSFPGYRYTVEHSVYIDPAFQGRGVGTVLMHWLFDAATDLGKRVMVAGVEAGNLASLRFHQRLGFVAAGTLQGVGFKFGKPLDLTFLCKNLVPDGSRDA